MTCMGDRVSCSELASEWQLLEGYVPAAWQALPVPRGRVPAPFLPQSCSCPSALESPGRTSLFSLEPLGCDALLASPKKIPVDLILSLKS